MLDLSKLKICYIAGTLGQGGAERQLFYAIQVLRQNGAAVQVLSFDRGGFWEEPIRRLGADVTWVGQDRSRFKRVCRVIKHLKKNPADVLQSQHFYTNAYATLSAHFLGIKAIGALRSNGVFDLSQSGRIGWINLHLPKVIASNSQSSIQYAIKNRVPRSRLFFLPNVVDTERFKPAGRTEEGPITLLAVGRLTQEKRFDRFISLIHELRTNRGLNVRGCIVGGTRGDQNLRSALEGRAAALGLRYDALQFLGSASDTSSIFQQANIFVLTSEHEGSPNVLLEAMASGLPVVATKVGGVPEIVRHGQTGFLVDQHRINELVDTTCELVHKPDLRAEIGGQARCYIEETHSIHRLASYLANLYEFALASRAGEQSKTSPDYSVANAVKPASMLRFAFRRTNNHERIV